MTDEIQEFQFQSAAIVPAGNENLGAGFEDTEPTTQRQPWLKLIQSNSPELKPDHERYLADARQGMFVNSASGRIFTSPLTLIPVRYSRSFVEWTEEGRVVGRYTAQDDTVRRAISANGNSTIKLKNPSSGNSINDTRYLFALVVESTDLTEVNLENAEPVVIAFKSTQIKPIETTIRTMRNIVMQGNSAREFFSFALSLSSYSTENKQKQQYYAPKIEVLQEEVSEALQAQGAAFYQFLVDGGLDQVLRTEANVGSTGTDGSVTVVDATVEDSPY